MVKRATGLGGDSCPVPESSVGINVPLCMTGGDCHLVSEGRQDASVSFEDEEGLDNKFHPGACPQGMQLGRGCPETTDV